MKNAKPFFFILFAVAGSVVQAKPQVIQSDIFQAIASGSQKAIKTALQMPSAVTSRNYVGQSVLHVAVGQGNRSLIFTLIKAGAQVNALDASGKTALDLAVEMKSHKVIYQLVKFGGKVSSEANIVRLKSIYKARAIKFFVAGWFFTPLLWIGTITSMNHASDVMVLAA